MSPRLIVLLLLSALLLPGNQATADTVTLEPAKDNTIFSESNNSDGSGPTFFSGRIRRFNNFRRTLIAFDLSGSIPDGSIVQSVTLSIRVDRDPSGPHNYSLHRLTRDWGEGSSNSGTSGGLGVPAQSGADATWNDAFFNGNNWSSSGGDFIQQASATSSVSGTGFADWSSAGLIADVQAWSNSQSTNFGWILIGEEGNSVSVKRFNSRNGSSANRPKLTVTFALPQPTNRERWQDLYFNEDELGMPEVSGDDVDRSGDGISNLLAYAFDLDPRLFQPDKLPTPVIDSNGFLSIDFIRDTRADDLLYIVEISSDLISWTELARSSGGVIPTGTGTISETAGATTRTVTVSDTVGGSRRFIRLIVEPL